MPLALRQHQCLAAARLVPALFGRADIAAFRAAVVRPAFAPGLKQAVGALKVDRPPGLAKRGAFLLDVVHERDSGIRAPSHAYDGSVGTDVVVIGEFPAIAGAVPSRRADWIVAHEVGQAEAVLHVAAFPTPASRTSATVRLEAFRTVDVAVQLGALRDIFRIPGVWGRIEKCVRGVGLTVVNSGVAVGGNVWQAFIPAVVVGGVPGSDIGTGI